MTTSKTPRTVRDGALNAALNNIIFAIHAEGGPPDRAALLLRRAAHELEQRRDAPMPRAPRKGEA